LTQASFDPIQRQHLLNLINSPRATNHQLLFVLLEDSTQAIKMAYRKLGLVFHPDKWPENVEQAAAAFQKIKNAFEILDR
jgi:DnaJ-class molecular chaperone